MAYQTLSKRLKGPVIEALKKDLSIANVHALPRIEKVVVNVGINKVKMDSKEMRAYIEESLRQITGQQPVFTKARLSISNFKVREGMITGAMVTLRGPRMEQFLDRLVSYVLPRIRDFRGLPKKLDGHGNYAIGIKDHSIFPEVPPPDAKQIFGLQIQITTTAQNDEEGMALLKQIGMPFKPDPKKDEAAEAKKEEQAKAKAEAEAAAAEEAAPAEETSESADDDTKKEADTTDDATADAPEADAKADDAGDAADDSTPSDS